MIAESPSLTIGVPVHNGAQYIIECLTALSKQSHSNFEVLVFENKSTDGTDHLVQGFCAADPRFKFFPSDEFLSMFDNFMRAFRGVSGRGEYFALRAYDDLSNDDYFEKLTDELAQRPDCGLAASTVQLFEDSDGACHPIEPRILKVDAQILKPENWGRFERPFKRITFPASWFYGVYRSSMSQNIFDALTTYPNMWAGDRLIVLKYLFTESLVYVPKTTFFCRTGSASYVHYTEKGIWQKIKARSRYFRAIWEYRHGLSEDIEFSSFAYFALCFKISASDTTYSVENIIKMVLGLRK